MSDINVAAAAAAVPSEEPVVEEKKEEEVPMVIDTTTVVERKKAIKKESKAKVPKIAKPKKEKQQPIPEAVVVKKIESKEEEEEYLPPIPFKKRKLEVQPIIAQSNLIVQAIRAKREAQRKALQAGNSSITPNMTPQNSSKDSVKSSTRPTAGDISSEDPDQKMQAIDVQEELEQIQTESIPSQVQSADNSGSTERLTDGGDLPFHKNTTQQQLQKAPGIHKQLAHALVKHSKWANRFKAKGK